MNATKEQFHNLAKGKSVRLTHHQISGGKHHVYLTRSQVNKLKKALENQRGGSIKLSQCQIKHHAMHGIGFFSDLVRHIKSTAKKVYHHIKPIAEPAIHEVGRHLKHHGNELLKQGINKLREKAMNEISRHSENASKRIAGFGIKPKQEKKKNRKDST